MKNILLSIIIPVYNGEKYIERCFQSLDLKNVQYPVEVIFVDDGSNDRTADICNKLRSTFNSVKYIKKENGGVSSARNVGLSAACGNWIMFVDVDDLVIENALNLIIPILLTEKNDIIQARLVFENSVNDIEMGNQFLIEPHKIQNIVLNRDKYMNQYPAFVCSSTHGIYGKCFNRLFLEQNNLRFIEGLHLGEDMIFYIRALENTKYSVLIVDVSVYKICIEHGSSTRRYNPQLVKSTVGFADYMQEYAIRNNKSEEFVMNMYLQICNHIRVGVEHNVYLSNNISDAIDMFNTVANNDSIQSAIRLSLNSHPFEFNFHWIRKWGGMKLIQLHMGYVYIMFQKFVFAWGNWRISRKYLKKVVE